MKISYCRDCTPTKPALAARRHAVVESHMVGGVEHTDIGSVDVSDDPPQPTETSQQYLDRLTTAYQTDFT